LLCHALIPSLKELGSDTGAVGLYCSKALGTHVVLIDLAEILALLERNRAVWCVSEGDVKIAPLDWTDKALPPDADCGGEGVDLILGSDLCTFRSLKTPSVELLCSLFLVVDYCAMNCPFWSVTFHAR